MKRFQINEKELNFLREMFVYINHDNEVSDQGLGELKEVFDRIASRPIVNALVDPKVFRDYEDEFKSLEEKEMTNETESQVEAPVSVEAYMEFVANDDREGAQAYLVQYFGDEGEVNQEDLAAFSAEVMEASKAKVEASLEEEAVAESTEIEEVAEEMEAVAGILAEATDEAPVLEDAALPAAEAKANDVESV